MVQSKIVMLRLVGFFKELGTAEHFCGSIHAAVRPGPDPAEERLIDYLEQGHVLLDVPETTSDVISGLHRIVGAPSLVTDGTWLWRLDLAYYVAQYHLALSPEFVDHVREQDFQMPPLTGEALEGVGREAMRYF